MPFPHKHECAVVISRVTELARPAELPGSNYQNSLFVNLSQFLADSPLIRYIRPALLRDSLNEAMARSWFYYRCVQDDLLYACSGPALAGWISQLFEHATISGLILGVCAATPSCGRQHSRGRILCSQGTRLCHLCGWASSSTVLQRLMMGIART